MQQVRDGVMALDGVATRLIDANSYFTANRWEILAFHKMQPGVPRLLCVQNGQSRNICRTGNDFAHVPHLPAHFRVKWRRIQHDGGYAEMMIAKASGLIAVPDDLSAVAAAPLLCAGLTTFSALRNAPARAGDLVAVFGVGGLGHLGVQYARHMGFEVVAIDRGDDRAELSKKLGAHHYIDSSTADVAKALQERGGAQVVLATASGGKAVAAAVGGLRRGGVVISLGASDEPIELSAFELLFKQLGVDGALTGTPKAGDATLRFSAMSDVAAMVETMPLERAPEAYARMMSGQARFRMVLTMA